MIYLEWNGFIIFNVWTALGELIMASVQPSFISLTEVWFRIGSLSLARSEAVETFAAGLRARLNRLESNDGTGKHTAVGGRGNIMNAS